MNGKPDPRAPSELSANLFSFIWRYSARDQFALLMLTLASFPVLYFSLTLPKLILNGAIQGQPSALDDYVPTMDQVTLLWLLSGLLLILIMANGVLKMRLNIYRGMVGERLIRRLRFIMIARTIDLPPEQARRISQGEAVSMITAESEPLTGVMGDAFAQPVFQLGQMLTILAFLFLQNVWLGVAGIALIPVQAYIIPRMQREVNKLQRARVAEVRQLSEQIGESVAGASALRLHGGQRRRLAQFSDRLHRMFDIRVEIFRKKFLIKFINNLLTQITPFLFYALGGYLVIKGQLSIGALVAAIAAARDIAEPWRELLMYWNQAQEASSRYTHLIRQFASRPARSESEHERTETDAPHLSGDIQLSNVSIASREGRPILDQIDATLPGGALIGLEILDDIARQAFVEVLTGEREADFGTVSVGGQRIADLSLDARAARIGTATSAPFIFRASVADNIRMPLKRRPPPGTHADAPTPQQLEAARTGNSADRIDIIWHDGGSSYLADHEEVERWWLRIIDAMGTSDYLLERALDDWLAAGAHDALAESLMAHQMHLLHQLAEEDLTDDVEPFAPAAFNSSLSIGENLLFAVRRRGHDEAGLIPLLRRLNALDIAPSLLAFAADLGAVLARAFGEVGPDHPLLRRLTSIRPAYFKRLVELADHMDPRKPLALPEADRLTLLELLFKMSARDLGSTVPGSLAAAIVAARGPAREGLGELPWLEFEPIVPGVFNHSLTILENMLGGTVRSRSSGRQRKLRRAVIDFILANHLEGQLRLLIGDVDAGLGGENLSPVARERLSLARALIRRPDLLILDRALASLPPPERQQVWQRVRALLPDSTLIIIEAEFRSHEGFDRILRIHEGRLARTAEPPETALATTPRSLLADQQDKFAAIGRVDEFRGLRSAQLELLAYASEWRRYAAGDYIFRAGDPTDGVYVVTEGRGEIRWPETEYQHADVIDEVHPGRLIGDLTVILDRDRMSSLVAATDMACLRIGEQEFRDILEGDIGVALQLLRKVSDHLHVVVHELGLVTHQSEDATPDN